MTSYQHLKATIRIGKSGVTPGVIDEIRHQLDKHGVVKIKMLASYYADKDRKQQARDLAKRTGARLVHAVGGTVVLVDRSKSPKKR